MPYPTTDPKFNRAFYHWSDASRTAYNLNLYSMDPLEDLLRFVSLKDLRELAVLLGVKKSGNKPVLILRLIEVLQKPNDKPHSMRGKMTLRLVPSVVD